MKEIAWSRICFTSNWISCVCLPKKSIISLRKALAISDQAAEGQVLKLLTHLLSAGM